MRLKNFTVFILTVPLMFGLMSCTRAATESGYDLVFKVLKDGEVFIHGSITVENEAGKVSTEAINENGVARFPAKNTEIKFWVGVTSGELFFFFGLLDVSIIEIQNGARLVVLDIGMPVPELIPDMQKKPKKEIWT